MFVFFSLINYFAGSTERPADEGDNVLQTLRNEITELQDLLKTEIVAHMKEAEMNNEQLKFVRHFSLFQFFFSCRSFMILPSLC